MLARGFRRRKAICALLGRHEGEPRTANVKDVACDLTARPNPQSERAPAEPSNSGLCGANYQIRRLFLRPGAGVSLHDGCRRSRSQISAMRRIWLALPGDSDACNNFDLATSASSLELRESSAHSRNERIGIDDR